MQWMLGESVLVSPVITPNTTTITPYFTKVSVHQLGMVVLVHHDDQQPMAVAVWPRGLLRVADVFSNR
jgi:hypothetical protein